MLTFLVACRNVGLLSFGAEPEEAVDPALAQTKFKSSHDVLTDDPRLRKEVIDDRGMSVQLPPELEGGGFAAGASKRRGDDDSKRDEVGKTLHRHCPTQNSCSPQLCW